ncbi:MAG: hypothetical protein ACXABY_00695 [Candidatus Thorarchaeota archaeon]|jgi:hypothetical protein
MNWRSNLIKALEVFPRPLYPEASFLECCVPDPECIVFLTSSPIVAKSKKLKAKWSMESADYLEAIHGVSVHSSDIEKALSAVLAAELKFEIDSEIIHSLGEKV